MQNIIKIIFWATFLLNVFIIKTLKQLKNVKMWKGLKNVKDVFYICIGSPSSSLHYRTSSKVMVI